MAHPAASLTGGRLAYTGRDRRAIGHRRAVIGDAVAPAGERGLDYPENLAARSPLQDGVARPPGAECDLPDQRGRGRTSSRNTGKYFAGRLACLRARAHADSRKSGEEKRKWCDGEIAVHHGDQGKKSTSCKRKSVASRVEHRR